MFDVGAQDGNSGLPRWKTDDWTVYAFEPNIYLYKYLYRNICKHLQIWVVKLGKYVPDYHVAYLNELDEEFLNHLVRTHRPEYMHMLKNYILIKKAVSDFEGRAKFNISKEYGCSSLLDFVDTIHESWNNLDDENAIKFATEQKGIEKLQPHTGLKMTKTVEVDVIRLDKFIEKNKIPRIDFFHCDAQGQDLNVLKGMGDYIELIQEGEIEMPRNKEVALYKGQYVLSDAMFYLKKNNFEIVDIEPNDVWHGACGEPGNEVNLKFRNKNAKKG